MAGAEKKAEKKKKKEEKEEKKGSSGLPGAFLVGARTVAALLVFGIGQVLASWGHASGPVPPEGEAPQRLSILGRLIFIIISQSVASNLFALLMLQLGRWLCGEPATGFEATVKERASHDFSIPWPPKDLLPADLKPFAAPHGQPFSLNHVSGRRRCKDACMRFGMMLGSCVAVWCTSAWMDRRSLASIGLTMDGPFFSEMAVGLCVGVVIVLFMFLVELQAGWIRFLRFFEVFDKTENFLTCFFWDVVFHLNVALNEEIPVRGWMLHNLAEAFASQLPVSPIAALVLAMAVESVFFVVMHLAAPGGAEWQSIINIFVGGMAGGLNVLFTGGRLGFALGWHFGWNITMGNVLGLSTSGIPISATIVSVVPHPEKTRYHGGVFGPEGGVVAPAAYGLGIVLLALIYGLPDGSMGLLAPAPR